jgi:ferritin-like metal-binding protein YciE
MKYQPENKQLVAWLNDAYAMEQSLVKVLEHHSKDVANFPELHTRFVQHLVETRRHAILLEECLEVLGEKPSAVKKLMGSAMGNVQGMASGIFTDELVKNLLADYSAEHIEIASYHALIAAAKELGHPRIEDLCTEILEEEEAMATWLLNQIPVLIQSFLQREAVSR